MLANPQTSLKVLCEHARNERSICLLWKSEKLREERERKRQRKIEISKISRSISNSRISYLHQRHVPLCPSPWKSCWLWNFCCLAKTNVVSKISHILFLTWNVSSYVGHWIVSFFVLRSSLFVCFDSISYLFRSKPNHNRPKW